MTGHPIHTKRFIPVLPVKMSDYLCEISIHDIDLTDERYKISFSRKDIGFLARSLIETGLVYPPIVRPVDDKFIIVTGFNRIRAHICNNQTCDTKTKIVVYKIRPDATDYQCLLKSIAATAFQRPLSQGELIVCIKRLYQFLNKQQIAEKSSAIFNTELTEKFIEDLLTIGNLPDPALELIHSGRLSLKSAKRICGFDEETIMVFLDIFSRIHASTSKQLEIILHIMEICARDSVAPKTLFQNQTIQDIVFHPENEPGIKTGFLRTYLFELRFPAVFKSRQQVKEKIASIKLGNNIKFSPPENLDSQDYSISFSAKNYNRFHAAVQILYTHLESRELKDLFDQ